MNQSFRHLLFACAVASLLAPSSAALAAPLLQGLGGPAGFGTGNLPANDDGSSDAIDVHRAFPDGLQFFGSSFTELWVNNNGNISFGGSNGTFTPQAFPVASLRMIAPWWGDVDTRGGGAPSRNGVYWSITPGQFVATWHNVGYFSSHDDLQNDFQLILSAAGPGVGDFDVEFRYNRCEWTTGDASGGTNGFGGTPAQAGFDAGNLHDYTALPGSLTRRILELCNTSNVGMTGVWRFAIRGGEVTCPGVGDACDTGQPGVCGPGTRMCVSMDASRCVGTTMPSDEVCNGQDDDCDGSVDEDISSATCGVGACETTVAMCVNGMPQDCVPGTPSSEQCDGVDDDCNGVIDDVNPITCGQGACMVTVTDCDHRTCVPGTPSPEQCNGIDDDCNGLVDDALDACVFQPDAGSSCYGVDCDPTLLAGRAGPIGNCKCSASAPPGRSGGLVLAGLALLLTRLRRRR